MRFRNLDRLGCARIWCICGIIEGSSLNHSRHGEGQRLSDKPRPARGSLSRFRRVSQSVRSVSVDRLGTAGARKGEPLHVLQPEENDLIVNTALDELRNRRAGHSLPVRPDHLVKETF